MKLPIPDDWDGEEFVCYRIQWPDSQLWLGYLLGILSQFMRGRLWDENTGSVIDAQLQGRALWDANNPLVLCNGVGPTPPDDGSDFGQFAYGGMVTSWEDVMSCGIIDLKIEDGVLWMRKLPCCDWVVVGAIYANTVQPLPVPDPGDTTSGFACNKAAYIAESLVGWMEGALTICQGAVGYMDAIYQIKIAFPQYHYNEASLVELVMLWIDASPQDQNDALDVLEDSDTVEALKCAWHRLLDNTTDVTYSQVEYMATTAGNIAWDDALTECSIGETLPKLLTGVLPLADVRLLALSGSTIEADCTCVATPVLPPTDPTVNGWYLSSPVTPDLTIDNVGNEGWKETYRYHEPGSGFEHDVFGVVFNTVKTGSMEFKPMGSSGCDHGDSLYANTSINMGTAFRNACGDSGVLDELFGAGAYILRNVGITWSDNPAAPNHAVATSTGICEHYETGFNEAGHGEILEFRWIHNTNSPSHS